MSEDRAEAVVRRTAAKVLLFDPSDRVLLFCREEWTGEGSRRVWFAPGGGLEAGESPADAARREVREEVGVDLADVGPVVAEFRAVFEFDGLTYEQDEVVFCVRVPALRVDRSDWDETERRAITAVRWWTLDELHVTDDRISPEGLVRVAEDELGPPSRRAGPPRAARGRTRHD